MLKKILEEFPDETFLTASNFDEAVIGVDTETMRLIYSVRKCIEILMVDSPYEDAMDYFALNVQGSYMGDKTPIWCDDDF